HTALRQVALRIPVRAGGRIQGTFEHRFVCAGGRHHPAEPAGPRARTTDPPARANETPGPRTGHRPAAKRTAGKGEAADHAETGRDTRSAEKPGHAAPSALGVDFRRETL